MTLGSVAKVPYDITLADNCWHTPDSHQVDSVVYRHRQEHSADKDRPDIIAQIEDVKLLNENAHKRQWGLMLCWFIAHDVSWHAQVTSTIEQHDLDWQSDLHVPILISTWQFQTNDLIKYSRCYQRPNPVDHRCWPHYTKTSWLFAHSDHSPTAIISPLADENGHSQTRHH